ncbi:hypothetical protein [Bacillus cereus]|uniref:hypothetical protein n=1 Tax=Bacillus cereus TaxID=1396 RepID=UPI001145B552|nr:hypothetical protein [Bacillus cereus]
MEKQSEVRTIFIPTGSITNIQYSLSESDQEFLYESSYQVAQKFLEIWNFEAYKKNYRDVH